MKKVMKKLLVNKKKVCLLWCWVQYYKTMGKEWFTFPKNTLLLSREDFEKITLHDIIQWKSSTSFSDFAFPTYPVRAYTNAQYRFEYLKIAEWCNNSCSFCIIPKLRGKQKSLSLETILQEAQQMIHNGIEEIILIAQDTSRYWVDIYGKPMLTNLLEHLDKLPWNFRYRLLYLYPDILSLQQLKTYSRLKKFIPYFDIPLQHSSSHLLNSMWRFYDDKAITRFLETIQESFPVHYIRTNIILWFPWETANDQKELISFLKKGYFDSVALFEYHDEPFAASSNLPKKVPADIIRKRLTETRKLLNTMIISQEEKRKGKQEIWYVMDIEDSWLIIVRPWLHAPEIDSYDEISYEQIIALFDNEKEIGIGSKIMYTL